GADDRRSTVALVPGQHDCADHIVEVYEVTSLEPVAVHSNTLVVQRCTHQPGYETVLVRHSRAVDIAEPQHTGGHVVSTGISGQQHLAGRFGGTVGRQRTQRHIRRDRRVAHVTD